MNGWNSLASAFSVLVLALVSASVGAQGNSGNNGNNNNNDTTDSSVAETVITGLADRPLYLAGGRGVPANLVLTPSVEFPTVESVANIDSNYLSSKEFVGYFNSNRCYVYNYASEEEDRYFSVSSTTSDRKCDGSGEWSGNFLNWAATQTIDPFRKALTGGYRAKDENSLTLLEKARHPGDSGTSNYPIRSLSGSTEIAGATPFSIPHTIRVRIHGLGSEMRFSLNSVGVNSNPEDYNPGQSDVTDSKAFEMSVRVKVCDPDAPGGVESNCVEYPNGNWKPEGLIQKNSERVRYSVFGYLLDSNMLRDGGVLRAAQKFVGPRYFDASAGGFQDNPRKEWDPSTGIIFENPNPDDAQATEDVSGVTIENSGVINYINKFGQTMVPGAPYYNEIAAYVSSSGSINFNKRHDPVSELYYAATRYLKGQSNVDAYSSLEVSDPSKEEMLRTKWLDGFPVLTEWEDPIQYECQANAILGIGDTNTGQDKNLPGDTSSVNEPSKPDEVKNDDTVDVVAETNRVGFIEGTTASIGEGNNFNSANNSAYIAGLAYNNHTKDIRPELSMPGKQTVSTHWVDVVEFGDLDPPLQNQYYLAAKYGGFDVPDDFDPDTREDALPENLWHTNGDTVNIGGTSFKRPDNYYIANQASRMVSGLEDAFENILTDSVGSSSRVTFNTATIETDTLLFGAEFNSANWTGNLYAAEITETEDGPPTVSETYEWEAGEKLDDRDLQSNPRNIYTYTDSGGIDFTKANLSAFTQAMQDDLSYSGNTSLAENRIDYLRGQSVTGLRVRKSRLGDIVNSSPVYVQAPSLSWPSAEPFGEAATVATDPNDFYSDFRSAQKDRQGVVYVGANDGMLHAFSAESGEELFAYLPEFLASNADDQGLHYLTRPSYSHRYYADLTPVVSDVYTETVNDSFDGWRTVLIGGGRTGAKGIFALDISDPSGFDNGASDIPMWEFTSEDDGRLGYVTEPPTIGLAAWGKNGGNTDYRWTVFLPNGYLSDTASTGLFMLDIEGGLDGEWTLDDDYQYIEFESGGSGLSPVRQVDLNGDRIIDKVYAGDLDGNIWVALGDGDKGWSKAYNSALFTATESGQAQPITAAPMVIRYPDDEESAAEQKIMVLFGTGKYLELSDVGTTATQSFYGVFDGNVGLTRDDLIDRTLNGDTVTVDGVTYSVRTSEGTELDPTSHSGWYVDLPDSGERINQPAQVRGNYIFVNSLVPTVNPCDIGGGGWIMAFGLDGRTPDRSVWPKLGDPFVGFKVEGGIPNMSSLIGDYALIPRSDSTLLSEEIDVGRQSDQLGRMSWQELYD
ncbi:MAG: hypothetical protein AWU57_1613 [Marinobacter sp. T13-3]|nr:MAG: hypothetical protein AWU57_1613 [Marinobacter sp. T13-3]